MSNNINKDTKKLNTFTLSGLIIGPILGSGLILLPPLLYNMVGNFTLVVWAIILILGFVFALIFGKLAILYPGDGGVSLATKEAMGKKYQLLTSFYLICAVFFGPVAVLIIAAQFIQPYFPNISLELLGFFTYIITYILLLIKIDSLGKIMLVVSSAITLIFLISSINIILQINEFSFLIPSISLNELGHALIIVFWSIVGWEVIGNYSTEVKDTKILTNSVKLSAIIISLVYILTTLAICFGEFPKDEDFKLVWIIEPIFKEYSNIILASVSTILCVGTLILFVGGVSRLISSLKLTSYTSKHLKNNTPIGALNLLSIIYIITLLLVYFDVLTLENLVAFADGFFIANAIIGLITAIILFEKGFFKTSAIILTILFGVILLFSNIFILAVIIGLFIFTYFKKSNSLK
ncbi:amino acid permease [Poseidonibacter lekithochrous]|uniref:APC family permease n=1 Tax=Poseidonibacter TaxID=2321187 RepID=UPI001C0920F3|nr:MULTISPECIES: amino acid permease [Poseidonibacter]MBU3016015.1 amino acid permease [Poseidonibacter lekithochrous]MDO6829314.1 amino acid permease [Poseidonibacter sp. 1_MG-2023]